MSVTKVNKDELAKIEATENKSLPFNENEYQDIAKTFVNLPKSSYHDPKSLFYSLEINLAFYYIN
jgi:hypothetical protein